MITDYKPYVDPGMVGLLTLTLAANTRLNVLCGLCGNGCKKGRLADLQECKDFRYRNLAYQRKEANE